MSTTPKTRARKPASTNKPVVAQAPAAVVAHTSAKAFVVEAEAMEENDFDRPMATTFLRSIDRVRAVPLSAAEAHVAPKSMESSRGYRRDDLFAVAEIAHHYLFSGGIKLALALLEGLVAVAPNEAYFHLALGLTYDRMNERANAKAAYARAAELDRCDGRADVNRAELLLEEGDVARARALFVSGAEKAAKRGDEDIAEKARVLVAHLDSKLQRRTK
jgi:Flp pilus assembly protein TadD